MTASPAQTKDTGGPSDAKASQLHRHYALALAINHIVEHILPLQRTMAQSIFTGSLNERVRNIVEVVSATRKA